MAPTLLVTQPLPEPTEQLLAQLFDTHFLYKATDPNLVLRETGDEIRAIAGYAVSASLIAHLPKLEIIANFGVGYDRVDVEAARGRGVKVTNTPDVLNDAMAEYAIGAMVTLSRKLLAADAFARSGQWAQNAFPLQSDLRGKTAGIAGLGRIGGEIAQRCAAMKMRVVYHGRNRQPDCEYTYYDNLIDMARDSDWLIVATPGGPETEGLIGTEVLGALGEKGYLLNISRGSVVDERALIASLRDHKLAGAALDVFAKEPMIADAFKSLPNTLLTPHIGSATVETRAAMGQLLVDNLRAHFAGRPLLSEVA